MGSVASRNKGNSFEWVTPCTFFARMEARYGPFDLDAAASWENACSLAFYQAGRHTDGLRNPWFGRTWCNPPYGRAHGRSTHGAFVLKAIQEVQQGNCDLAALLVPAATDTHWFRSAWMEAAEITFFTGRLRFNDGRSGGTFPSCVLAFSDALRTPGQSAPRVALERSYPKGES